MILRKRKERKELIECINSQYLTTKSLKEYINMIEEEDIKGELWNEFKKVFINNLEKIEENHDQILKMKEEERKRKEEEERKRKEEEERKRKEEEERKRKEEEEEKKKQHYFNGNDYFNGIINYLKNQYGNILDQNIISISSNKSECSSHPIKSLIEYGSTTCWHNGSQNEWFEIDFKNISVRITGYSIKSCSNHYLKNWIIEGRTNSGGWITIDTKNNDPYLNGNSLEHYYQISQSTEPFRYVRLRSTGNCHSNCGTFYIDSFEIFGSINQQ